MTRAELLEKVRSICEGSPTGEMSDEAFNETALAIFEYQVANNPAYRNHCEKRDRDPERVSDWTEIPAVPTGIFRHLRWATFPAEETVRTFQTSGTTGSGSGRHHFRTLELYDAACLENWRVHCLPDRDRIRLLSLTPSPEEAPDSSLVYMIQRVMDRFGTPDSFWGLSGDALDLDRVLSAFEADEPIGLLGPAFSFVHLCDALKEEDRRLELPAGTRIMETGGTKGRSRTLTQLELHEMIREHLGVPSPRIVNEYGMTELTSQFYDTLLADAREENVRFRGKGIPPWTRIRILDPETFEPLDDGEEGVIRIWDLANLDSAVCIQTEDLGFRLPDGRFEILGRHDRGEARGCSLLIEEILGE